MKKGHDGEFEANFPRASVKGGPGRSEVTTRSVVPLTDKTSFETPTPRYPAPPPNPPNGEKIEVESESEFSMVTAPKTPPGRETFKERRISPKP